MLLSKSWMEDWLWEKGKHLGPMISHGPSKSFADETWCWHFLLPACLENVNSSLRDSYLDITQTETLERSRWCPNFLVPQRHPFSGDKHLQLRISSFLLEILLVFDFTAEQQHVYVHYVNDQEVVHQTNWLRQIKHILHEDSCYVYH